jgi:hypothetical protein
MVEETVRDEIEELASEVRRIIEENRRLLERLMDDDFEPEEPEEKDEELPEEL